MKIRTFLNVLISVLVVFIVFNLFIPHSSQEGFVEGATSEPAPGQGKTTPPPAPRSKQMVDPSNQMVSSRNQMVGTRNQMDGSRNQMDGSSNQIIYPEVSKILSDIYQNISKFQNTSKHSEIMSIFNERLQNGIRGKPKQQQMDAVLQLKHIIGEKIGPPGGQQGGQQGGPPSGQ